jgi:hypothetical protein
MIRNGYAPCILAMIFLVAPTFAQSRPAATDSLASVFRDDANKENGDDKGNSPETKETKFDKFEPYDPKEEPRKTSAGTPLIDPLLTEHAFLEREVSFLLFRTNGVDQHTANREEIFPELTWQLNNRFEVIVSSPFIFRHPTDGDRDFYGFSDMVAGLRFLAFDGEHSILTFGANLQAPTGAADHHLGTGYTSIEPAMYWWQDLGSATVLQTELIVSSPVGEPQGVSEFRYNVALTHTFPGTGSWKYFQWLTPTIELNGLTELDSTSSGRTVLNLMPGIIWMQGPKDQFGVGFSFPVTGSRDFDSQILVSYIHAF